MFSLCIMDNRCTKTILPSKDEGDVGCPGRTKGPKQISLKVLDVRIYW